MKHSTTKPAAVASDTYTIVLLTFEGTSSPVAETARKYANLCSQAFPIISPSCKLTKYISKNVFLVNFTSAVQVKKKGKKDKTIPEKYLCPKDTKPEFLILRTVKEKLADCEFPYVVDFKGFLFRKSHEPQGNSAPEDFLWE